MQKSGESLGFGDDLRQHYAQFSNVSCVVSRFNDPSSKLDSQDS